jgi:DNA replication protein DnaC
MTDEMEALLKCDAELQAEFDKVYAVRRAEAKRRERRERFLNLCPPDYQDSDPARIPNQRAMRIVLAWEPGPRGMVLKGNTGTGKTRSVWMRLRQIVETTDLRVMAYNGVTWGTAVSSAFRDTDETERFMARVIASDIFFLDDAFKSNFSDTQARALYYVFEERVSHRRPVILTANSTGKDVLARLPQAWHGEDGASLLRRIRESSETIPF